MKDLWTIKDLNGEVIVSSDDPELIRNYLMMTHYAGRPEEMLYRNGMFYMRLPSLCYRNDLTRYLYENI